MSRARTAGAALQDDAFAAANKPAQNADQTKAVLKAYVIFNVNHQGQRQRAFRNAGVQKITKEKEHRAGMPENFAFFL